MNLQKDGMQVYDLHTVTYPEHLQINAPVSHVVQKVSEDTINNQIRSF